MPLQNRVTPFGDLVSHPVRYPDPTVMFGNRGVLHNDRREVVRTHNGKMWLACRLHVERTRKVQRDDNRAFNGRKRVLMAPRRYTELFFLDEPTAFAAGHRPCGCCRRQDFKGFMAAWTTAFPREQAWTASDVDAVLQSERLSAEGTKILHTASLSALPPGAMITLENEPWLLWGNKLHRWSHEGYVQQRSDVPGDQQVQLLTPPSLVAAICAGFRPGLPHISARGDAQREATEHATEPLKLEPDMFEATPTPAPTHMDPTAGDRTDQGQPHKRMRL